MVLVLCEAMHKFHDARKSPYGNAVSHDIGFAMKKYRNIVGWGAIVVSALAFLPLPLPALPPMLSAGMLRAVPAIGTILMLLSPMLLFAAGIGLVRGWDGGRKLFVIWAAISVSWACRITERPARRATMASAVPQAPAPMMAKRSMATLL